MEKINWGIIGCGDVTELKSGPAFNKIKNSVLVAVMRRDGAKAQDYANRHGVSKWYDEAKLLINDPDINAIYIATPPSSHELYTLAAIEAGKAVYVEKPMTINYASAERMMVTAAKKNIKLSVAHYRREQPKFKKIKELLDQGAIGKVRLARLNFAQKPLTINDLNVPKTAWRVDPSVAGGGLFHDLSPHQLDLMIYFFGNPKSASGAASSQGNLYNADDLVAGFIRFENDVI
ncbi:MAG: Gfo/Idh/MocA family oxidoreductase, partial [Chitinophagaceae bacterium]